jgi:hypothetical protein
MIAPKKPSKASSVPAFRLFLAAFLSMTLTSPVFAEWAKTAIVPEASQKCDDPEPGGDLLKTIEIADQRDSAPRAKGAAGNWYVTRTTKWIPYCMYHDPNGLFSLDTYALTPKIIDEEVQVCEAVTGSGGGPPGSRPVAPFAGPCPPAR